jgi:hypothetical protein
MAEREAKISTPTFEQVLKDAQSLPVEKRRLLSELLESPKSLEEIAAEQGVKPFDFDAAQREARFWPEEESIDDFIATLQEWRREGSDREIN